MFRAGISVLVAALIAGLTCGAAAQTTVTVSSPNVATPTPLQILDTDYPFQSLLAAEEGRTGLNLILDPNGRVRTPQIISSSGSPILDGRAVQIARTWTFQLQNAAGEVRVEVDWKLPLSSADEYALPLPVPPEGSVVVGAKATSSHALQRSDYPTASIQKREQGEISLTFRVGTDGKTSDVQVVDSSGYSLLDASAVRVVQRWTYSPGTIDGKISGFWTYAIVVFFIGRPPPEASMRCRSRPLFLAHDRNGQPNDGKPLTAGWWISLNDSALITDALLFTAKGWKRVNASIIHPTSGMAEARALIRPGAYVVGKKPSVACWVASRG